MIFNINFLAKYKNTVDICFKDLIMTTNTITFSQERAYLISFLKVVLKKEGQNNIIIANNFYDMLKTLIKKAPEEYTVSKNRLKENQVRIDLPGWDDINTNYNYYLSKNSQKILEDWLYNKFWMIFDMHMTKLYKKIQFKLAIYNFMEQYDIPPEKYEMLKKNNQRKRKSLISKKTSKISSAFNNTLSLNRPVMSAIVLLCLFFM